MKQVAQAIRGGEPKLRDVPPPALRPGGVLVRTVFSLVSPGTERAVVSLAGQSLLGKARSRPDQVRQVIAKLRSEGLAATLDAVRGRLGGEIPLGYSSAGIVEAAGEGVSDIHPGLRVACAGMGHASHAERVFVPRNLLVPVPPGVDLREASTVTLGAIALQGIRRADVRLGERVGVIGLGVLGLLTVQMLRASGCHVFAVDLDRTKVELAASLGAEIALARDEPGLAERARTFGRGHGLDAAIVTAATDSSDPAILGAECCRLGGRLVIVGTTGLDIPRRLLYDRELDVRMARSYGPGRYDPVYEERGIDYPYAFVRFTEGRNMEEYLALLGRGEVDVGPLLTHEFGIEDAEEAYRLLLSEEGRSAVGLLFRYGAPAPDPRVVMAAVVGRGRSVAGSVGVSLVGAGSFARGVLLPALRREPRCFLSGVVTATGLSAVSAARLFRFRYATTALEEVLADEGTDAVIVATRHDEHARIAAAALRAGKDVFVEKPAALCREDLAMLAATVRETGRILMVGFNRRFAPAAREVQRLFRERSGPLQAVYRVDAGDLPADHWTRDPAVGGGRVRGEACHFVDLLCWLVGRPPVRVHAESLAGDGISATIRFEDGSVATLVYSVSGGPAGGKERLEVFGDGRTVVVDGFRRLTVAGSGRVRRIGVARDKGHRAELSAFVEAVRNGGPSPVPFSEAETSTRLTFALVESAARGRSLRLGEEA
ncbi:MAG: bi-domain-containing oxidoreductase [Planctomycetes bacterium]|jgi:predicted dehydrogenase/threonine dehydrogenase-like Zn-dependent dehydrogenase|nr:bi-domain-containing oxidoreductase [Planctomycetota bacterium]